MFAHDIPPSEVRRHEHAPYLPGLVYLTSFLERLADTAEKAEAEKAGAEARGMYGFPLALAADGKGEDKD